MNDVDLEGGGLEYVRACGGRREGGTRAVRRREGGSKMRVRDGVFNM